MRLWPSPGRLSVFIGFYNTSNTTAQTFGNFFANASPAISGYYVISNYNFNPNPYVRLEMLCLTNFVDCVSLMAPLNTGCVVINNATDCRVTVYNSPYDYILAQTSVRGGNINNTPSDISIYGSYFNSSNIVQGKIDPLGNSTSVSPQMRTSIMSISCGAALFSDNTNSKRQTRLDTLTKFGENTLRNYSNQVYWNEPMHDFPQNDWKERYWGGLANYNRMLNVKLQYDPNNYFTCYHCIGYDSVASGIEPTLCPSEDRTCTCNNNPKGTCSIYAFSSSKHFSESISLFGMMILTFLLI
jgi:hypothetical protein